MNKAVAEVVLQASSVSMIYKDAGREVSVLNELDFSLEKGEQLAIIGSSGSGKSTLLNILGGLDSPSQGEVLINGENLHSGNESRRAEIRNKTLGFVYQFHHLLPEFTALENVSMPLLMRNEPLPEVKQRAAEILESVGLKDRLSHKPAQLSGGERQRVAIARALVGKPAVVLMDEPTGNLDRNTAQSVQKLIDQLNQEHQIAFVLVTHDPELAQRTGRVLELIDGKLVER
ncbi:lipoprotein-releasing ABC transporter ATP-binding protein LolD [Neptuniibacter sp.]|uniref:lipoprotein-releasing ABC transporter ATP-binding protein LolD n=1 Tax=Neptuniibacter sp. TaxID=1962643 RepID=UPI0026164ABE|nr:lipoprotein-releasing ABC transporter ATP-binding protein LolD [Neptuniibacter sp.]MCP4596692.1 lipoprotein-releasing ABC transporter ATP-binding protein LolD [Neptuniibacter sp.]